jgi:hypothetical protein
MARGVALARFESAWERLKKVRAERAVVRDARKRARRMTASGRRAYVAEVMRNYRFGKEARS